MTTKHTPGPWVAAGPTIMSAPTDASPTGYAIAHVLNPYAGATGAADRVDANARLIAAAPELLAALLVAEQFCNDRGGSWSDFEATVRAAIAKATGSAA